MTWDFTEDLQNEIIERLENGEGLLKICTDSHIPSRSTVLRYQEENPDFEARCARASLNGAEYHVEHCLDIGDKTLSGLYKADAAKVAISNKQWYAAKLIPKKYGDASLIKHADANGNALAAPTVNLIFGTNKQLEAPTIDGD